MTSFNVILDGTHKEVTINPKDYSDFAHGYAATVHKVQGMTVDHTLVYGSGYYWNRHLTYVAMTRHRETCQLYVPDKEINTLNARLGRLGTKDSLLDFPLSFAERRNMDITSLLKTFSKRLAARLAALKDQLINKIGLNSQTKAIPTLNSILLDFINKELKLTELISEMRTLRLTNPQAGLILSKQIISYDKTIGTWGEKLIQFPYIKDALRKIEGIKPQPLASRGGFKTLKWRLINNELNQDDYNTLLKQFKNKAQSHSKRIAADRALKGRTQ